MGEQRRGVYLFKQDSSGGVKVDKVDASDVWHRRLGHLSKAIMSLFSRKMGLFETKVLINFVMYALELNRIGCLLL